jgi:carbonic anhydrase/acetyltransferase-like protein (isoleucine patch superfamily)
VASLQTEFHRICRVYPDYHKANIPEIKTPDTKCNTRVDSTNRSRGDIENLSGDTSHIHIGERAYVQGQLLIYSHGGKITISDWCYVGIRSEIWSIDPIKIG